MDPSNSCNYDDIFAALDDDGAPVVDGVCEPGPPAIGGTFSPSEPLSGFNGESGNGTWTLTVDDTVSAYDDGTLNDWSLDFTCLAMADLSISKSDSTDPVLAGDNLTYTVMVDNAGPNDATNVVVTDTLPAGVTFVSTTGCSNDPNGVPTCNLGTVIAGGSASFDIEVTVNPGTSGTLTNSVSVSSDTADPEPGDNSTSEDTTANLEHADLSITKTDSADPVTATDNLTYTVMVHNAGPHDATNVVVTDTLPAGVSFVGTVGCANDPFGVASCNLGTLTAGADAQFDITVAVASTTSGLITNTASVASDVPDPDSSNDSAEEDTDVVSRPLPGQSCVESGGNGCPSQPIESTHSSTMDVRDCGVLTDVDVGLDIGHRWIGDLKVSVTSPAGTSVVILDAVLNGTGSCVEDNVFAVLDDDAATPVQTVCENTDPSIDGTFDPDSPLSVFNGELADGIWTLTVDDLVTFADDGTLNDWSLDLTCSAEPEPPTTHYNCYNAVTSEDSEFEGTRNLGLNDQFGSQGYDTVKVERLCAPANKTPLNYLEAAPVVPAALDGTHLEGYKIEESGLSCGPCEGGVGHLTIQYKGEDPIEITVDGKVTEPGPWELERDESFELWGDDKNGRMGSTLKLLATNGDEIASFHTSCSQPFGIGIESGAFEVVGGSSIDAGELGACDEPIPWLIKDPWASCTPCEGGVSHAKFAYTGAPSVVMVTDKKGEVLFDAPLATDEELEIWPLDGEDRLPKTIFLTGADGTVEIHTSCSKPFGPGLMVGEFTELEASSKEGGDDMCPVVRIDNQFGTEFLTVDRAERLLVPTIKDPASGRCRAETYRRTRITTSVMG